MPYVLYAFNLGLMKGRGRKEFTHQFLCRLPFGKECAAIVFPLPKIAGTASTLCPGFEFRTTISEMEATDQLFLTYVRLKKDKFWSDMTSKKQTFLKTMKQKKDLISHFGVMVKTHQQTHHVCGDSEDLLLLSPPYHGLCLLRGGGTGHVTFL